jgi:opacity protein-like surface antigen
MQAYEALYNAWWPIGRTMTIALAFVAVMLFVLAGRAQAQEFRLQGNFGYNAVISGFDQDVFEVDGTTINLADAITGDGFVGGASLYLDKLVGQNWTVGVEYQFSRAEGASQISAGTGRLRTKTEVDLHTFFLNGAYRVNDPNFRWHPFIGIGVGAGLAYLDITLEASNAGSFASASGTLDSVHGGLQGFLGFDYDLTENLYLGTIAKLYYVNGEVVGEKIVVGQFIIMGSIGWRF